MPSLDLPDKQFNQLSRDEKFLWKLRKTVESNLENEQFGVENLAAAMAMSRTQLYRKVHKLTGKNVSQYIREFRLKKAMKLLKDNVASVAEISYQAGFSSPAYFNKCFHDFYGFPPGDVIKKHLEEKRTAEDGEGKEIPVESLKKTIIERYILYTLLVLVGVILIITGVGYIVKVKKITVTAGSAIEKTIAVLPFWNLGPDSDHEYFFNGMQEEISNQLQKIGDIIVRPRQSVEQYKNTQKDIPSIGRELNAAFVLEGSGWLLADSIRMRIKLTDAKTNEQVWGEAFNLPYSADTIFEVQAQIAIKVATSLGAVITKVEQKRIDSRYKVSIEALRLHMRGRREISDFWDGLGRHHADSAMDLYNQVLAIEPEFAFALASKGEVFLHRDGNLDSTVYYCKKAIQLDPEEGYGYWVLAACYQKMEMLDLSIENFLRTIELLPNVAGPHAKLGYLYITHKQDVVKGLPYLKRSIELAPLRDLDHLIASMCYLDIGDYEKAKEHAINTIIYGEIHTCLGIYQYYTSLINQHQLNEGLAFLDSISSLINCKDICNRGYWFINLNLKNFEQAEKDYLQWIDTGNSMELSDSIFLAYMYKQLGKQEDYQTTINFCRIRCEDLWEKNKKKFNYIGNLIPLYTVMDEEEKALYYLTEFEKTGFHFNHFDFIEISPIYENIRENSGLQAILKRVDKKKSAMRVQIREMEEKGGD